MVERLKMFGVHLWTNEIGILNRLPYKGSREPGMPGVQMKNDQMFQDSDMLGGERQK